jgi:hypothetical protein
MNLKPDFRFISKNNWIGESAFPEEMKQKLLEFVIQKNLLWTFDCWEFAEYMNGLDQKRPQSMSNWTARRFVPGVISPWETIIISQSDKLATQGKPLEDQEYNGYNTLDVPQYKQGEYLSLRIVHFAIYVGEELYISLLGTSWPIIATTLDQMKKMFQGDIVHAIDPNTRTSCI